MRYKASIQPDSNREYMDMVSHALLTNLIFKEAPTGQRIWAIIFSVLPDALSFVPLFATDFFKKMLFFKRPPTSLYPRYIFTIYTVFHSLVIWCVVFLLLLLFKLEWWAIAYLGWGMHIIIDIFTHSKRAFSTQIFWPFSNYSFSGISWSSKWFIIINYSVILVLYIIFYF